MNTIGPAVGLQLPDDAEQLLDLRRREDGGRLVEDEAAGVAGERLDDLDPLLDADREVLDERVGVDREAVARRQLLDPVAGRPAGRGSRTGFVCSTPSMTFSATVKTGTSLKCWCTIPMPAAMASLGPSEADRLAVEQDLALVGLVQPEEHVHQRRLAGAVLPEEGVDLARLERRARRPRWRRRRGTAW